MYWRVSDMGKMLYKWKCLECGSIVNHKGLCRDCTEYSKGGDIVKPVQRIKVDFDGNEIVKDANSDRDYVFRDGTAGRRGFRAPKKMTKKQMKLAEEEAAIMAEAMKKLAESQENDEEVVEFGESVLEEE
jgi:hypothetical protein